MKKISEKQMDQIASVVAKTLSKDFENIEIITVKVVQDQDRDGQDLLQIQVIFDGIIKDSDALHVAGAARRLRPALEAIDPELYPLLSFISKVDFERGLGKREGG